jgi:hypothetical protein
MAARLASLRHTLARVGEGQTGPLRLAVVLALVSAPFVAASFLQPPMFDVDAGFSPPEPGPALIVAALATLGAAFLGGMVGGVVVKRMPTLGAAAAIAIAWPIGVSLIPIVARLFGLSFETAYSCFDTCGSMISSADPWSGVGAYLVSFFVSVVTLVPIAILIVCVCGAFRLNRAGYPFVSTVLVGIGYGALHFFTMLAGSAPAIAFLLLVLGVATWTWALRPSSTLAPR